MCVCTLCVGMCVHVCACVSESVCVAAAEGDEHVAVLLEEDRVAMHVYDPFQDNDAAEVCVCVCGCVRVRVWLCGCL